MAGPVVVKLDRSWAPKQFIPGGTANRYVDRRARVALRIMNATTPTRSGELRRHNKKTGTLNRGLYRAACEVYNDASYAAAVHGGTLGKRIRPTSSQAMPIPVARYAVRTFPVGPGFPKKFVNGQEPQPWLQLACDLAFRNVK